MKKVWRMLSIIFIACIMLTIATPVRAEGQRKIIRVGYIGYESFIGTDEKGNYEGYA